MIESDIKISEKVDIENLEHVDAIATDAKVEHVLDDARHASDAEKQMTLWQAIKLYPRAVAWSVGISAALIMEGYDTALMGNFYAYPAFQSRYGTLDPTTGEYQIPAKWQAGLNNSSAAGEIIGLFIAGIISERIGYRWTLIGAHMMVICFIFILFFAKNLPMLLVGEILCGIPWGVFQTLTTTYASEVTPVALRAYLTTYVNMCWVIGQFIASGVLKGLVNRNDWEWSYKIPFAIQWIWPIPLALIVYFAPESPWYLVRHGKAREAVESLERLTSRNQPDFDADKTVAMMVHTDTVERENRDGTTYWDLFKGANLRRTEIACMVWSIQNLCGNALGGSYFFEQAGLPDSDSFTLTLVNYAIGLIGTAISWYAMKFCGRRTLYLIGTSVMCLIMFIVGFLSFNHSKGSSWAIGGVLLFFTFVYDFTVGPACYSLVPEIASSRLRTKSTILARNVYNVIGIVNGVITPYMINPTAWNWGAKTGFFWAGIGVLTTTWVFFRLPEPKGRTFAELDVLFEQKVPARQFAKTEVDPFAIHHDIDRVALHTVF
jgi:SP family general alpha glucoside:H+ symporter-like MFS transporter